MPGKPHPLQRARHGHGHTYDTTANVQAKDLIRLFARWKGPAYTEPVHIEIRCCYTRAHPTADVDNLAKTVLDAFNKFVIRDDKQVMSLHVYKGGGFVKDETHITMTAYEST